MRTKKRRKKMPEKLSKAAWYLARGYTSSAVAEKLGVHRNTVLLWRRELGYAVDTKETGAVTGEIRTLNWLLQRTRALSPAGRRWLAKHMVEAGT